MWRNRAYVLAAAGIGVVSAARPILLGWLFVAVGILAGAYALTRPLATGLALGVPAVAAAPFLTPRGDGDGLWVLVFPVAVFWAGAAGGAHAGIAALAARRRADRGATDI